MTTAITNNNNSRRMRHTDSFPTTVTTRSRRCRRSLLSGAAALVVVGLAQPAHAWVSSPSTTSTPVSLLKSPSVSHTASLPISRRPSLTRRFVANVDSSDKALQQQQQQLLQDDLDVDATLALATTTTSLDDDDTTTTSIITGTQTSLIVNSAIIGALGALSAYGLLHTHLEALAALWEYDLGAHTADVTKAAVALDVMGRWPVDLVHTYEELVPQNPIFYKACTSGVAYGLGDFISQLLQGKRLEELDMPRSFRSAAAGFIAHGPLCHFWLLTMEEYLDFGGAWWATGLKVTADLTVWSIFLNFAYSSIIGLLAGKKPDEVWKDIQATQWPALRSAWRFWPFVHTISFSHAVPLDLKLLWVDVMEVVWVTILSKVNNEDKAAALAATPEAELSLQLTESVATTAAGEEELKSASPLEQAAETTQKVWNAAWPLVAMWPVLWAGFQVEHMLGLVE